MLATCILLMVISVQRRAQAAVSSGAMRKVKFAGHKLYARRWRPLSKIHQPHLQMHEVVRCRLVMYPFSRGLLGRMTVTIDADCNSFALLRHAGSTGRLIAL